MPVVSGSAAARSSSVKDDANDALVGEEADARAGGLAEAARGRVVDRVAGQQVADRIGREHRRRDELQQAAVDLGDDDCRGAASLHRLRRAAARAATSRPGCEAAAEPASSVPPVVGDPQQVDAEARRAGSARPTRACRDRRSRGALEREVAPRAAPVSPRRRSARSASSARKTLAGDVELAPQAALDPGAAPRRRPTQASPAAPPAMSKAKGRKIFVRSRRRAHQLTRRSARRRAPASRARAARRRA